MKGDLPKKFTLLEFVGGTWRNTQSLCEAFYREFSAFSGVPDPAFLREKWQAMERLTEKIN
ncbi:MAG: hypothetical protein ACO27L_03650 [Schleiferiaceae bacterium]